MLQIFQVDLVERHCFPVYWNGENRRVLRGHWFARKGGLDWLPLREDVSEQLEYAYRSQVLFSGYSVNYADKVNLCVTLNCVFRYLSWCLITS